MSGIKYDTEKFKVYTWKHPVMLHWILNPALAINELVLGQRIPKITLIEKDPSKSLQENSKVPCPNCNTIHPGAKWNYKNNATGNWFGLYCDQCGQIIPCLLNLTSALILLISFPFWFPFKKKAKQNWLNKQARRYEHLELAQNQNPYDKYGWIKIGLLWGTFMFLTMTFVVPLLFDEAITMRRVMVAIPVWIVSGLVFGYRMKAFNQKVNKSKTALD